MTHVDCSGHTNHFPKEKVIKLRLPWKPLLMFSALLIQGAYNSTLAQGPILNPANGHYYELVVGPRSWTAARAEAETRVFRGQTGHLATITSAQENQFISQNFQSSNIFLLWIGGFQTDNSSDPAVGWQWVTGEPWGYTNWSTGEPNDSGGQIENRLEMTGTSTGVGNGTWNDVFDNPVGRNQGYVVEYDVGTPIARLDLNGKSALDFGPLIPARTAPASPPSDIFTIENTGNAPLVVSIASLLRTGSEADGQKITNADDRNLYSLRAINAGGTEIPIGIGSASIIGIGQRQSFRVLYNPILPLVADRTRGLSASQVLQETNTSTVTINQNGGDPLRVNLIGRINPTVQMVGSVLFRRDGSDIVVEAAAHDPNLNTYLMRFQFLDSAGRNVGLAADVDLRDAIQKSTIVKGQSFTVEQRFPGAASNQSITSVRVTAYDGEGNSTATSGTTGQTVNALAIVSAASYSEFGVASGALASAFGSGLATITVEASSRPLPTSWGGTTVKVKDSMGTERLASLFYVSPTQVNYLIPEDTKPGLATITITSSDGKVAMGTTTIAWIAPSLFSANSDGKGVAAAAIQRVKIDGAQSYEAVATFDQAQNKLVAIPINLDTASEQVYLTLFGTGIRHCSSLVTAKAIIGGIDVPLAYAGAQGDYVGLDQVNVLLPRSLIGRGEVEVKLMMEYQETNVVKINIR